MSAGKGFCTRHQHDIASRLKFAGMWHLVKAQDGQLAKDIALAWLHGELRREYLCPLVITMLELQAKANRMAEQGTGQKGAHVATCPCCAIMRMADDDAADVKVIRGMVDEVIRPLMQTNGLMPGGTQRNLMLVRA